MAEIKSVDAGALTKAAEAAAQKVLGENLKSFGESVSLGSHLGNGTVGLIWRNPDLERLNAAQLMTFSRDIASEMKSLVGDVRPVVQIFDGGVTAGFFPIEPIVTREMF